MSLRDKFDFDEEPLYIMDGNAFIFRGYHANSRMTRSDDFPTGAMYIVGRTLLKIMREERPKYFLFVLDGKGPHFRHDIFPDYKAHRDPTPENLLVQFEPIRNMIERLGISIEVSKNCEADDCIASLAKRYSKERPVIIIGMDKDLRQCLNKNVIMWDPATKEEKILTDEIFKTNTGLNPSQWADAQALIGDTADNIPGVKGIGEVKAVKLLQMFPNLEAIRDGFENLPASEKKKMEGNLESMFLYRKLTTLSTDMCQDLTLEDMNIKNSNEQNTLDFFQEFELKSLAKDFSDLVRKKYILVNDNFVPKEENHAREKQEEQKPEPIQNQTQSEEKQKTTQKKEALEINFVENLPDCTGKTLAIIVDKEIDEEKTVHKKIYLALGTVPKEVLDFVATFPNTKKENHIEISKENIDIQKNPKPSQKSSKREPKATQQSLFGLMEHTKTTTKKPNLAEEATKLRTLSTKEAQDILFTGNFEELLPYMQKASHIILCDLKKYMHEYPDLTSFFSENSQTKQALNPKDFQQFFDLSIGAWLLSPDEKDYSFATLSKQYLKEKKNSVANTQETQEFCQDAHIALELYENMLRKMHERSLLNLMLEMETPLVPILYSMEREGIQVDVAALFSFLEEVRTKLAELSTQIFTIAGGEFNIRSGQQMGEILFKKLNLPMSKSTKGGQASTSQESLEKLAGTHDIIAPLQEFRKLEKLRSTYLEPLPRMTGKDGRIHTTLNQCATGTGRLSSSNPNLQNIPIRGELGQRMRACFTAKPNYSLVSADYSQVELRVLAHCSGDETLRNAFLNNEDIHARTAALLYNTNIDSITQDMRRHAKTINFGLLYGMGSRKLAQDLQITNQKAKHFMEVYFSKFQQIKDFYEEIEKFARENAYVVTLAGRQRTLPNILSEKNQDRALAERQAVNTMIQGSAADIIKLAMIAVNKDKLLKELNAKLLLQIHDELILEVPNENAKSAGKRMAEIMMNITPKNKRLSVPLLVDYGVSENWGGAH